MPPVPLWDPLQFAVEQAHARGLELHAWFNPYRAKEPSAKGPLAPTHIARRHPELVKKYGTQLWMDPGEPAVRAQTLRVVLDVVKRYDIDGVHLDDYFYPYPGAPPERIHGFSRRSELEGVPEARRHARARRLATEQCRRTRRDAAPGDRETEAVGEVRDLAVPALAPGIPGIGHDRTRCVRRAVRGFAKVVRERMGGLPLAAALPARG